jgi:hypothetical protein
MDLSSGGRTAAVPDRKRQGTGMAQSDENMGAVAVPLPTAPKDAAGQAPVVARWPWLRHWELWLALALGTLLRVWRLDLTQFLDDQTGLMVLARQGILRHALPITGIPSSIQALNPPLSIYLLMPFTAFSANPLPVVVVLALWNVLGIAVCYVFALRYFGRRVAAASALLFATCGGAILYSRFLWQQNYLPPVMALWGITLYAGCVRGWRGWLFPNVVLALVAILLHPTAALLLPVTLVAVLIAPEWPRRRDYVALACAVVVLLAPTVLFQILSGGSDIRLFLRFARRGSALNLDVFQILWQILGGPVPTDTTQPLAGLDPWLPILNGLVVALVAGGFALLTWRVAQPAVRVLRALPADSGPRVRLERRLVALWQGLRGDAAWRAHLLLWLWFTIPLLGLLRHSAVLFVHYLLVELPVVFIVAGLAVDRLLALRVTGPASARAGDLERWWRFGPALTVVAPLLTVALLAAIVAGQTLRSLQVMGAAAAGHFVAYAGGGYPLSEMRTADQQLRTLEQRQGATAVFLEAPADIRYRAPLDYLLVSEQPDRVEIAANCLLAPAAQAGPALIVPTLPGTAAEAFLATLPNARHVADVPLAGGPVWPVYRVEGAVPSLSDEVPAGGAEFHDAAGNGLRLEAVAAPEPGVLRLRWTVLSSSGSSNGPREWYRVEAHAMSAVNAPLYGRDDCQPNRWQAGETLFTWVTLAVRTDGPPVSPSGPLTIDVHGGTLDLDVESVGPLRVLSDRAGGVGPTPLQASGGAPPGHVTPGNTYTFPSLVVGRP